MRSEVRARSNYASAEKTPKPSFPAAVVASTAAPCREHLEAHPPAVKA